MNRREFLAASASTLAAFATAAEPKPRMGVVIHSYGLQKFEDPLAFLDHCRSIGAGGAQIGIGLRDDAYASKVRQFLGTYGMYLEGSIRTPRDKDDVGRFDAEVRSSKACGATVLRAALGGRRYELFDSTEAFAKFTADSFESLRLARPVVEKHEVRLAVENHKDWRVGDLLGMLRKLDSPRIGVCIDTGNSIALLEEPHAVVEAYAAHAFTTHIKDMGVEEYADGFLLSEVPLGHGYLDLKRIVTAVWKAHPEARLNLEMITRDPLQIPCLTKSYWATFGDLKAPELADALSMVRTNKPKQPLPRVAGLSQEERTKLEEENVRACLKWAGERL